MARKVTIGNQASRQVLQVEQPKSGSVVSDASSAVVERRSCGLCGGICERFADGGVSLCRCRRCPEFSAQQIGPERHQKAPSFAHSGDVLAEMAARMEPRTAGGAMAERAVA